MNASHPWMIYGANGYTGRLIAAEAVRRGLRPTLAGRSGDAVGALAAKLACPSRVFDLNTVDGIVRNLHGMRAVLHCAGPFSATAVPMMEACLLAGVHYTDITGEIDVIESAAARHEQAQRAHVALMPAVGFDVVPSDCLAAALKAALPSATHLQLAFASDGGLSPGTTKTMIEGLPHGGKARINGRIQAVPSAWKSREIPFRGQTRHAVTIPWGDVASAYYSTGIPNIEVYTGMPPGTEQKIRRIRWLMPALGARPVQRLLKWWVARTVKGPNREELETGRASLWGRVEDAEGKAVEATLETPGGYPLTVATSLAVIQRLLDGRGPTGFATASQAFGKDFVLEVPGTDLQLGPVAS